MVLGKKILNIEDISQEDFDRFWSHISTFEGGEKGDCWEVDYHINKWGYSKMRLNNKMFNCHYFAWRVFNPEAEDDIDKIICHSCDNPICVNPKHLRLDTPKSNNLDTRNRYRMPSQKLKTEDVLEIKKLLSEGKLIQKEIGNKFGVSKATICDIKKGRIWSNVL